MHYVWHMRSSTSATKSLHMQSKFARGSLDLDSLKIVAYSHFLENLMGV